MFTLLIFSCIVVNGQERVNRENPVILKTSVKLTDAIGWKLNSNGKWIENKNVICDEICSEYRKSYEENFNWIQSYLISYKKQKYYVIVRERESGYYTYPAIHKDWNVEKGFDYYVIKEKDYLKFLANYNKKSSKILRLKQGTFGYYTDRFADDHNLSSLENIIIKIGTGIDDMDKYPSYGESGPIVQFYNDKIRFNIDDVSLSKEPNKLMADNYFECSLEEFGKIIITE